MGMVLTQDFTNNTGGFFVGRVGTNTHVLHGEKDAPMDGLEAIAHVRDGASNDDAHGIVEVSCAHFIVYTNRLKSAGVAYDGFFSGNFRCFSHVFSFGAAKLVDLHNLFIIPYLSDKNRETAKMRLFSRLDHLKRKTLRGQVAAKNGEICKKKARIVRSGL